MDALKRFGAQCDVITYEFENLPVEPLRVLGDKLRPGLKSLAITGSYVAGLHELRELVALAQRVALPSIPLDLRPMHTVNQALDDLAHGRVVGRVVLQP